MRTWQLERTRVGFLFDARALFASVQEEGEGKLYIKKREIPIRIVDLTRNGAKPSPALSSYAGHLQTNRGLCKTVDGPDCALRILLRSLLSPRAHCHCQSGRCGTNRVQCIECTEDFSFSTASRGNNSTAYYYLLHIQ